MKAARPGARVFRLRALLKKVIGGKAGVKSRLARLWVLSDTLNLDAVQDRAGKSRPTAPE